MARIPLEDNFNDVIAKAQRGLAISDDALAKLAEVSLPDLAAVQAGKPLDAVIRRVARHLRLSPNALEALAHKQWYPQQPVFPRGFAAFNSAYGELTVNSYLLWDPRDRIAAAFDTGTDAQPMIDLIDSERLTLRYIFLTHTHEDHVGDLARLAANSKAEVWLHELETDRPPEAKTFKENAHFHVGTLSIKTLLTSGHSPGMTSYYVTGLSWPLAIVGDAIFASSMGGSQTAYKQQFENNRRKLLTLPRDTVFACGHGPLTTLAQEKQHNPFYAK